MNVNAELLCTTLLEQARRRGEVPKWIQVAISFIKQQDAALRDAREGLRDQLGARAELVTAQTELTELRGDRDELVDVLGNWVGHCPDCDGAGEIARTDDSAEPCEFCGPALKLLERLRPPPARSAPPAHEGENDDITF